MFPYNIKNNLIYSRNAIISVFKLEPLDVFLLSEEDKYIFFQKLAELFNILNTSIQINILNYQIDENEFNDHFESILSEAKDQKTRFIKDYIQGIKSIAQSNCIFKKNYFLQIRSENKNRIKALEELNNSINKLFSSFKKLGFDITPLNNSSLQIYISKYFK